MQYSIGSLEMKIKILMEEKLLVLPVSTQDIGGNRDKIK